MTAWKDKGLQPALFHHAIAIGAGIVVRPSAVYYGSACFYGARAAAFIFSIQALLVYSCLGGWSSFCLLGICGCRGKGQKK
jgi:hypothetical protein